MSMPWHGSVASQSIAEISVSRVKWSDR